MAIDDVQDSAKPNETITPYCLLSTVTNNQGFIHALILKEWTDREDIKGF